MTDQPCIPNEQLCQLLNWLAEAETADSYSGFTYVGWLQRKPQTAIQTLNEYRWACIDE